MLFSDIKQSFRLMANRRLNSFIQIIGLGIGLGSVILMLTFILHEYSFDKYHKNSASIYRIVYNKGCTTPYIMGESFKQHFPEIRNLFRLYPVWNTQVKKANELVKEDNFILADSAMFSILDIPLLSGNKKLLLADLNSLVISDRIAKKHFGAENPVGKQMEISMSGKMVIFNITGVYRHFPTNSSLQSDFIGNIKLAFHAIKSGTFLFGSAQEVDEQTISTDWEHRNFQTFLQLDGLTNTQILEKKASAYCQQNDGTNRDKTFQLQAFTKMYLYSEDISNFRPLIISNLKTIKIFEGIAFLILLLAFLNYILLSSAQTQSQFKEIACRKVLGASLSKIAQKAYVHSILMSLLSLIPAMLFVKMFIPFFNQMLDKNITINLFLKPQYLITIVVITIITGFAGGSYVGLYAIRLKPVNLFKPQVGNKSSNMPTHGGILIVFQFVVFVFLFASAIIIDKQIRYSESKGQGFDSNHILIVRLNDGELRKKVAVIKSKLLSNPHVLGIASSFFIPPGESFLSLSIGTGKDAIKEEGLFIGNGLFELLKIPMIEGSGFPDTKKSNTKDQVVMAKSASDEYSNNGMIINESAAKKYKVKVGDKIGTHPIRGIVKDFHAHSMHRSINPMLIFRMEETESPELAIRTDGNSATVIETARKACAEILPDNLFEYEFLNDRISSFYNKEKKQVKTVTFFSFLAIALAIMGLFGYVSINLLKRTKEIGIRKVNGARVIEILTMLNAGFIKWVLIAFVIACPIAYYAMHQWLQNFAYKTELSWWVFATAGLLAVAVAVLTVSWQSWRAATRNPVESLRYE